MEKNKVEQKIFQVLFYWNLRFIYVYSKYKFQKVKKHDLYTYKINKESKFINPLEVEPAEL